MNGSAKRLTAIIMVTAMIASAMVIVLTDEQDSSADEPTASNYYYNQLDMKFSKAVYDAVKGKYTAGSYEDLAFTITVDPSEISIFESKESGPDKDEYFVSKQINKGIIAAVYDNPLIGFYISTTNPAGSITHEGGYTSISFTVNKISAYSSAMSTYKTEMTDKINEIVTPISSATTSSKVTSLHDTVAGTLSYDKEHASSSDPTGSIIRSAYTALCGDHKVVCEGYAKMFKVLCDAVDVPCLIVTGKAGTDGTFENHMWNYVEVDGLWYLIDCTWDDQQDNPMGTIVNDYLMAGWATEGFDSVKIVDSHLATGLDTGFVVDKSLSYYKYGSPGTQYTVTFLYDPELEPTKVYRTQYVGEGATAVIPEDPADRVGRHFWGWYLHGTDTEYTFNDPVNSDLTIDGKWTSVEVYTLRYDTCGGTNVQATRVEVTDNVTKITDIEPKKEGYKFIEWNTSKDGKGVSYKAGDEITLVGDATLYAVWEDTSSVSYKIDNLLGKAAEFLSKETIPGVSNLLLTIGVITTVISLLAVAAIARK